MRVGLLTASSISKDDFDMPPLLAAFRDAGVSAEAVAWDDPQSDAAAHDACVLRSTWNYCHTPEAFIAWLEHAASVSRLFNPLPVVRWNVHKSYLRDLEQSGVPIVPTEFVPRGAPPDCARLLADRGWSDIVIKPAVSAGSFQTRRFAAGETAAAQAFLAEQCPLRDMLIQPYQRSVDTVGERSLVWIDGAVTHVVRKQARFAGGAESVAAAAAADAEESAFADVAVARWRDVLLYARVDTMRDDSGALQLSELELIEPSLFFAQGPTALPRFVSALVRRI